MKKLLVVTLSMLLLLSAFTACGKNKSDKSDSNYSQIGNTQSKTESTAPKKTGKNFLTGETVSDTTAVGKRPVAIMINNLKDALPQYGIGAADIMYEIPVEGGITRMMAVYNDYTKIPRVCSIRSCRYYFPLIALGMDAIYVHWGQDPSIATETLKRTGINRLEGGSIGSEFFGRDPQRQKTYASEHTGFFEGSKMPEAIDKLKYRKELSSNYKETLFNFNDTQITPTGTPCTTAKLDFSGPYFSTFTYDTASQTYKKQHSGKPHVDSSTGAQLAFKNVIILQTTIKNRPNSKLMDVDLSKGKGKYVTNGVAIDIAWSKGADNAPIVLTNADGSPLKLNQGKSYIAFIGTDKPVTIS